MYARVKHSLIRTRVSRTEGLHFSAFHYVIIQKSVIMSQLHIFIVKYFIRGDIELKPR